jgi:DNA-binding beta-propeller fold protein YncE
VALAALFAIVVPQAFAARSYESQLTQENGNPFLTPFGLTTDSADNVWVSDTGTFIVSKFDSSGTYLAQNDGTGSWSGSPYVQGLAFGAGTGLIYAADSNLDDIWGLNASDATYSGTDFFGGAYDSAPHQGCCFLRVAVDNSGAATDGDIYVSSHQHGLVRIDATGAAADFSASQSYITANQITGTPDHAFSNPHGVAVDTAGNVYLLDLDLKEVDEFDATGTFIRTFTGSFEDPTAVAIDPTNGHVLIGDDLQHEVHEFNSAGVEVETVDGSATPDGFMAPQGLAVDSTGRLYVADESHPVVDVFSSAGTATPKQTLTVNVEGEGEVASTPAGISACDQAASPCSHEFDESTEVELEATAAPGSHFVGWSTEAGSQEGTCTGTESPCTTGELTEALTLRADFAANPPQPLTVNFGGTGSGSVQCDTGSGPAACLAEYPEGTTVTVIDTPAAGSHFVEWLGECDNVTGNECALTIAGPRTVEALNDLNSGAVLTVQVNGEGTVTSNPAGIDCAAFTECSEEFEGTVILTGNAATGYVLAGWFGCEHTSLLAHTCEVTMSAAREVTAVFLKEGTEGAQGPQGDPGNPGSQGPQGNPGPTGPTGNPGAAGATGSQGPAGSKGDKGDKGDTGATGPQGPAAKVTCKVKQKGHKVKVTCKVKQSAGASSLRWRLFRHGHRYRHGTARHGRLQLGTLPEGRYALHVQGAGRTLIIVG